MAEDSDLEKTEEPTGRRIEQAREKGQVPQSRELGTFTVLVVSASMLWMMGDWFMARAVALTRQAFIIELRYMRDPAMMLPRLAELSGDALYIMAPWFAVLIVAALIPPFFLNSWIFSFNSLVPDLARMNPVSGLARMFSWNSLMELGKAVLKAILVGGVAVWLIWRTRDEIFGLLGEPLEVGIAHGGEMIMFAFLMLVLSLFLVVVADVPFQLWHYYHKLKMTKDEVKQEMKEMMGDPHVKARIRRLQMEASRRRMMQSVPQADVIVTNPTHYAIALSYKAGMAAPKVVAKGVGMVAMKIREIGAESAVPTMEAAPLARALYKHAALDKEIPSALFNAVAEVLAYVYQLAQWRQTGGAYPVPPRQLDVPPELVPEAT